VASAFFDAVIRARLGGKGALPMDTLIERASGIITSNPRYSQEGFDNVISRFSQPRNRHRRLA
jgi:hypothetical protein